MNINLKIWRREKVSYVSFVALIWTIMFNFYSDAVLISEYKDPLMQLKLKLRIVSALRNSVHVVMKFDISQIHINSLRSGSTALSQRLNLITIHYFPVCCIRAYNWVISFPSRAFQRERPTLLWLSSYRSSPAILQLCHPLSLSIAQDSQ